MADPIIIQATGSAVTTVDTRSLSAIRSRVLKNLGSDSDYYPNDEIDEYINICLDECAEMSGANEATDTQTTVVGTYEYTLDDAVIQVRAVIYDSRVLDKVDYVTMLSLYGDNTATELTGTPYCWASYGVNKIRLFPTPDEAVTLEIVSTSYADPLATDSDYSVFLRTVDRLAEYFATAMLAGRDDENGKYSLYMSLYNKLKRRFNLNAKKRPRTAGTQSKSINYSSLGEL